MSVLSGAATALTRPSTIAAHTAQRTRLPVPRVRARSPMVRSGIPGVRMRADDATLGAVGAPMGVPLRVFEDHSAIPAGPPMLRQIPGQVTQMPRGALGAGGMQAMGPMQGAPMMGVNGQAPMHPGLGAMGGMLQAGNEIGPFPQAQPGLGPLGGGTPMQGGLPPGFTIQDLLQLLGMLAPRSGLPGVRLGAGGMPPA